jgi:hypothetical protein
MYQPYPQDTHLPETRHLPAPASVLNAVRIMYVGAATSILGIVIDVLTVGATKKAIERRSHHLSVSQINSSQHVLVIAFIIGGLIGAVVWFFLARSCLAGQNWARITGTVLFGLATVDTLGGLSAPIAGAVKIWAILVWLIGLTAVVFLWRRSSTESFKATPA